MLAVCPAVKFSAVPSPLVSMAKPVTVSGSPSTSLSGVPSVSTLPLADPLIGTLLTSSVATGGLFGPPNTVSVSVLPAESAPSVTVYEIAGTVPVKPAAGVNV